jgi:methanogenic corrinoid protein MtbC1
MDRFEAEAAFDRALAGLTPVQAVEQLVLPTLQQIGADWEEGRLALSQVYMSGRFCEELVERVLPASDPDRKHQPRSAIVVLSDYHELGKRIVYSVLRASGFEIFDYGRLDVDALVERARADRVRVLLISVLILPSALKVAEVSRRLREGDPGLRIVVGGAPFLFDRQLWREVGADAMGANTGEAVALLQRYMQEQQR